MDNVSPEERLLRLIRKGRKPSAPKQKEQPQVVKQKRLVFSYELFSRILPLICVILGFYLLVDLLILKPKRIVQTNSQSTEIQGNQPAPEVSTKPLSFYKDPVKSKQLFTATAATAEQAQASATFKEMIANLKLQGIISGPSPQAVIEDAQSGRVYFLSPGEQIGEIELKAILPGKVKLLYQGQEIELSL
ncbi:MAG: hypothetical protein HQ595_03650 [Candidatus Omnitrophica bacterium]|nr:hypothetical protein [Candidatus Omnitrophota bacterium]